MENTNADDRVERLRQTLLFTNKLWLPRSDQPFSPRVKRILSQIRRENLVICKENTVPLINKCVLITFLLDNIFTLFGEVTSWSLFAVKGVRTFNRCVPLVIADFKSSFDLGRNSRNEPAIFGSGRSMTILERTAETEPTYSLRGTGPFPAFIYLIFLIIYIKRLR